MAIKFTFTKEELTTILQRHIKEKYLECEIDDVVVHTSEWVTDDFNMLEVSVKDPV